MGRFPKKGASAGGARLKLPGQAAILWAEGSALNTTNILIDGYPPKHRMEKIFVGRQPIYDRNLRVYAYELLYRAGDSAHAGVIDGDLATSSVIINTLTEIGLEKVAGNKRAFLNLTRRFLIGDHPIPFPPDQFTLEILEDVKVDADLIKAIHDLKQQKFEIALDDYEGRPEHAPLLTLADIVKVDLMGVERARLPDMVHHLKQKKLRLLAEKVETQDDFDICLQLGFDYFQGYFLCRPKVLDAQRIPGNRLAIVQLLAKLQNPEAQLDELVSLISQNVTLSYKLLRFVNSAHLAIGREIASIHQAVVLLGQKTIRNLAALMTMNEVYDKPDELMRLSMVRARMCESLAGTNRANQGLYFTVGLFSTLDALLDAPMATVMQSLPLAPDVQDALVSHQGPAGEALAAVIRFERGEWDHPDCRAFDEHVLGDSYLDAINWADGLFADVLSSS